VDLTQNTESMWKQSPGKKTYSFHLGQSIHAASSANGASEQFTQNYSRIIWLGKHRHKFVINI